MKYQTIVHLEQLRTIAQENPDALRTEVEPDKPKSSFNFDQTLSQYCAATLASNEHLIPALKAPRVFSQRVWLISTIVVALFGALAANSSLQQTAGKINVYWVLVSLVAFNLLSLGVWIIGALMHRTAKKGFVNGHGHTTINATQWLFERINPSLESAAWRGWAATNFKGRMGFWRISRITHLNWAIYSFTGFLALLVIFSLSYFDFAWGSTLLSDQQFEQLTSWMGAPMDWLGIAPNTQGAWNTFNTPLDDTQRRVWAQWLLIAVLLYGVAPRLIALLVSHVSLKYAEENVKLDTSGSWYSNLRQKLMGTPVFTAITDPDQSAVSALPDFQIHQLDTPDNAAWVALEPATPIKQLENELLGYASQSHHDKTPINFIGSINSAQDLDKLLKLLDDATPASSALVILVDIQRTPDRGHQRVLSSLVKNRSCWLALRVPDTNRLTPNQLNQRFSQWLNAATQSGISEKCVGILPQQVQRE